MSRKLTKEMLYSLEMEQKMAADSFQKSTIESERVRHLDDIQLLGAARRDLAEIENRRVTTKLFWCLCFAAVCVGIMALALASRMWF